MNDPKPFASLGSGLLARKGAARPAMRRQFEIFTPPPPNSTEPLDGFEEDDLGWNDMGHDVPPHDYQASDGQGEYGGATDHYADPTGYSAPAYDHSGGYQPPEYQPDQYQPYTPTHYGSPGETPVHDLQGRIATALGTEYEDENAFSDDEAVASGEVDLVAPGMLNSLVRRPAFADYADSGMKERRVAVTVRLDQDRHSRLRELTTARGVSTQTLVLEAIDLLLTDFGSSEQAASF